MFYLSLVFFKLSGFILSFFPRRAFLAMGRQLGALLHRIGFRTQIVRENLALAYPDKDQNWREELERKNYQHLGILLLEMFRFFYRFDLFIEKYSKVENEENLRNALALDRGILVMTAHLGNWEVLSASGPQLFATSVTMVTKELKPKWIHRTIEINRSLLGVKMACEPKTMNGILRGLKNKEIVGFVMDQFAGAPVGARVPFFGKPVGSHTALATLSLRMGVPVVPAIAYRNEKGFYTIRFEPAMPLLEGATQEDSVILNTAAYVAQTEKWVREFPEQWMWIHKRWKGDLSPLPENCVGEMMK